MKPEFLRKVGVQVDEQLKLTNDNGRLGLVGVELMMRGHPVRINIKTEKGKIAKLEKDGYEKFGEVINGMQTYRKQLTKAERKAKGEIEDAAYAIKATGDLMLNDLAVYKFYSDINSKFGHITKKELDRLLKISKSTKATADEKAFASSLYKAHKKSGQKLYDELSPEEKVGLVQMPTVKMPKTGLNRYGDLAGKWLPKDIADDIKVQRAFSEGESWLGKLYQQEWFQRYRRMNSIWKRTKTSWNPTVHTNNIVSNFFLLDSHNVPLDTFLEHGFKVYTKSGQENLNKLDLGFGESNTYEDLVRLGVFDASLARTELRIGKADWKAEYAREFLNLKIKRKTRTDDPVKDTEDIFEMSTNIASRSYQKYVNFLNKAKIGEGIIGKKIAGKEALKNPLKWTDKGLTDLYQREDQMFRVALYIDRLEKGIKGLDKAAFLKKGSAEYMNAIEQIKRAAAKDARQGFIDYNIQAPFINLLRDTGLPFFSYTYRVIPLLAKTATLQPSKFAKWAAIGYALDYAGRERSKQDTEYERALMDERRLSRWFGLPFMPPTFIKLGDIPRGAEQFAQKRFDYALGWGLDRDVNGNKLPETSHYMDIMRFLPGGDVLGQTTPESGGRIAGLPAPFQPSFGLAGEVVIPMLGGIDPFTGKDISESDEVDYWERFKFVVARLVPNNPLLGFSGLQKLFGSEERNDFFDSWSHKKIMNALEKRPDSSAYAPDLPVFMALLQTVGIKIWPIDTQKLRAVHTVRYKQQIKELRELIKKKQRDVIEDYYGTPTYEKRQEKVSRDAAELIEKIEDIMIEARLVDAKRFKRRKREFGEVPISIIESILTDE
jgi:predicted transcriptional regulator